MKDLYWNLLVGAASALGLGFATHLIDLAFIAHGIHPATETLFDDISIGSLGGLAVFLATAWRTERESRLRERLVLIAELNHHVRNALTAIVMYAEHPDMKQRISVIADEVERIDWVLKELVPTAGQHEGAPRLLEKKS